MITRVDRCVRMNFSLLLCIIFKFVFASSFNETDCCLISSHPIYSSQWASCPDSAGFLLYCESCHCFSREVPVIVVPPGTEIHNLASSKLQTCFKESAA